MELITKQGFKKTEVGLIPEDWDAKRIGDIALIERGKFTPRPRNNPIYYGGEIPFVQTGDVTRCNGKISHYSQTLNKIGLGVSKLFPKGSILMTIAANIGYTGVLQIDMACPDSLIGINGKQVENEFLNFHFQFRRNEIEELSTSGAQKNLNIELFRPFLIPIPPSLTEQKAIATALSDVDALISSLQQSITKKKAIKQGAMQQLLTPPHKGGKRLPGFSGEWLEKTLGEVSGFQNGAAHENCVVSNGDYIIVNSKFISTEGRIMKYSNKNLCPVHKDEILMVLSDVPNGKAIAKCFYVEENNKYTLNQRICSFSSDKVNSRFLFLLLNRNPYYLQFDDGVKQTNLRNQDVLSCPLSIPPSIAEQEEISKIIFDLDRSISLSSRKKEKYQAIKQGMMQELLMGKTRLV